MEISAHINKGVKLELLGVLNASDDKELWEHLQYFNHDVPVYFVGAIENRFEKIKQNNFIIPLKNRNCYLQFEVNMKTKKIYFMRSHQELDPNWKLLHTFKDIKFLQSRDSKDNDGFYHILVARINATIDVSKEELGDSDIFNIWTNYLQTEEKIIKKLNTTKKPYTIKKIISTTPENLIVELDRPFKSEQGAGNNVSFDIFSDTIKREGSLEVIELISKEKIRLSAKIIAPSALKVGFVIVPNYVGNIIEIRRKRRALESLFKNKAANPLLKSIMTNPESLEHHNEKALVNKWFKEDLSEDSKLVIENILSHNDLYLVQGPPGTGKTTLITELCQQLITQNKKVLVASQGNLAVDNVAERIFPYSDFKALRLGNVSSLSTPEARHAHPDVLSKNLIKESLTSLQEKMAQLSGMDKLNYDETNLRELENLYDLQKKIYKARERSSHLESHLAQQRELLSTLKSENNEFILLENEFKSLYREDSFISCVEFYLSYGLERKKLENLKRLKGQIDNLEKNLESDKKHLVELNTTKAEIDHARDNIQYLKNKLVTANKRKGNFFGDVANFFSGSPIAIEDEILANEKIIAQNSYIDSNIKECTLQIEKKSLELKNVQGEVKKSFPKQYKDLNVITENLVRYEEAIRFSKGDGLQRIRSLMLKVDEDSIRDIHQRARDIFNSIEEAKSSIRSYSEDIQSLAEELEHTETEEKQLRIKVKRVFLSENLLSVSTELIESLREEFKKSEKSEKLKKTMIPIEELSKSLFSEKAIDKKLINDWLQKRCQIAMTTCSSSASGVLDTFKDDFDYVIIDETSKALPTELLIPLLRGKSIVMVGDHKQLPPFVNNASLQEFDDSDKEFIKESLFERLFERANDENKFLLTTQYRMPPQLAEVVSNEFYEGKIRTSESVYQGRAFGSLNSNLLFVDIKSGENKSLNGSKFNNDEIKGIEDFLSFHKYYLKQEGMSVGIISMYKSQKYKLDFLTNKFIDLDLEVGTVDSFQGREKDLIILSTVVSEGKLGFLKDPRRINVAISRAKKGIVLFGDRKTLENSSHFKNILHSLQEIKVAS